MWRVQYVDASSRQVREMPSKKKVEILPDAGPRKINFED
jgi:hypothetical protein